MFRCVIDIFCLQLKTISYVPVNCQCEVPYIYIYYFLASYECIVLDCLSEQKFLMSNYWSVQRIAWHMCMGRYKSTQHPTIGRYSVVGRYKSTQLCRVWLLLASLHLDGNLLPCTPPGPLHVEAKVKVIASPAAVVVRSYNAGARRVHGTHHTRHGPTCMFFF